MSNTEKLVTSLVQALEGHTVKGAKNPPPQSTNRSTRRAKPKKKRSPAKEKTGPVAKPKVVSPNEENALMEKSITKKGPQAVLGSVDAGVMVASEYGVPLSFPDLLNLCEAIMVQYAMNTGLFVNDNGDGDVIPATNPSSFMLYCLGIAMTWIAKNGQLGGSNKNDVCLDPSNLEVPVALAKFLEHIAPCCEDGAKLSTTYNLDFSMSTSQIAYPDPALYPANTRTADFPNFEFVSTYMDKNYGEYYGYSKTQTVQLADLWSGLSKAISQEIKQAGFLTVRYSKIPRIAPNASAYAAWIDPVSGLSTAVGNGSGYVAANIFRDYDAEEALLFAAQAKRAAPLNPVTKPIPMPSRVPALAFDSNPIYYVPAWFTPAYTAAFLGTRQESYPVGSYLGRKGLGMQVAGQKVKTWNISYQVISPQSIGQTIAVITRCAIDQTDADWTNTELETFRALMSIIGHTLVQHRLNFASPFPYNSNTNVAQNIYNPQAYFVDQDWASTSIPPLLQRFIDAIGYVVVDGSLVVPYIVSQDNSQRGGTAITSAQTAPIGTIRLAVYAGIETISGRIMDQIYGSIPTGQVPPAIRINGVALTYDNFISGWYKASDTTNDTSRRCCNFINGNKGQIISQWRGILERHCTGPSMNDSLIQPKNMLHGRCSSMLTQVVVGRNAPKWELFPAVQTTAAVYQYTFRCYEAAVVGGLVALPRVCLVDSIAQCASFDYNDDSRLNQGKYSFQVRSGASTDSFMTQISNRTMAPNSSVSQAFLAARGRAAKRPVIEVGSSRLPSTAPVEDWASPAMERIYTTVASVLDVPSKLAGFPLNLVAGPFARSLVGGAASVVVDKLCSWAKVGSADPPHPKPSLLHGLLNAAVPPAVQKQITNTAHDTRPNPGAPVKN